MSDSKAMSRRDFLKTGALVGGGLVIAFHFPFAGGRAGAAEESSPYAPNAWMRIAPDNTVTLIMNKSEMGQGVYTSLPMLIAEELEVEWRKIRVEAAPVAPVYNHTTFGVQATGGSTSIATSYEQMRRIGATAREMLIAAAAQEWRVQPKACHAEKGMVIHGASGRKASYGKLVDRAAQLPVPREVVLKKPEQFRIIGRVMPRLDTPEKVDGSAIFGLDVTLPGMMVAVLARPPVFGARVAQLKDEKARKIPGVKDVLQVPQGVAVIATGFWPARQGRDLLEIAWDEGAGAALSTAGMREEYRQLAQKPGTTARQEGSPDKALAGAVKRLVAEYEVPYLAHATMEPLNCVVELKADSCEIWTGTQFQTVDRDNAALVAGLKPEQVKIHTMLLGGGFGRRANPYSDFVREAVAVAKAARVPVKVIWTREDDMRGGYYRPFWYDRLSAGLDKDGKPVAWEHRIVGQSIMAGTPFAAMIKNGIDPASVEGAADLPYAIPNLSVELHTAENAVPVQWWRSVGHSHTAFVVESFMDELAHAANKDPVAFRRDLLAKHPRHKGVLELAARKAGWGKPLPRGRFRGIAMHSSFDSYVAQVAELSVAENGTISIHKVTCAVDCGRVMNPDTVKAQMESGIAFGLSAALHGAITLKGGRVEQGNFDDYPVVRLDEMPRVEVHIVPSTAKPTGVGEPGVPPIAPAVANALFAATGVRLRALPMTPAAVLKGLAERSGS